MSKPFNLTSSDSEHAPKRSQQRHHSGTAAHLGKDEFLKTVMLGQLKAFRSRESRLQASCNWLKNTDTLKQE